jgi:hypothetical protein
MNAQSAQIAGAARRLAALSEAVAQQPMRPATLLPLHPQIRRASPDERRLLAGEADAALMARLAGCADAGGVSLGHVAPLKERLDAMAKLAEAALPRESAEARFVKAAAAELAALQRGVAAAEKRPAAAAPPPPPRSEQEDEIAGLEAELEEAEKLQAATEQALQAERGPASRLSRARPQGLTPPLL